MAHAAITLGKADIGSTGNAISWVGTTASVPAALANGSLDRTINSFTISGSAVRSTNLTIQFALSGSGDLTSGMETGGTVDIAYGDASARFLLSPGGGGITVFADTSNPYTWTIVQATELDIHSKLRWVLETIANDISVNSSAQHDIILTLWDGVGDSPFPADPPAPTYESELTFTTPSDAWNTNSVRYAIVPHTPRPAFSAPFKPDTDDKFLEQLVMRRDRQGIILFVSGSATGARSNTPEEPLSTAFLTRGEIELTVANKSVIVPMGGPDVFDPRNPNQEPDTTEFYRVDLRGLSAIRYERWVNGFAASQQAWQAVFRIRAADTPVERQGARKGAAKLTGAYFGTKPLRIYRGSKLVYDFRPSA